jgi:hypothetical protein
MQYAVAENPKCTTRAKVDCYLQNFAMDGDCSFALPGRPDGKVVDRRSYNAVPGILR